jgi:protein-S-isoprenylcysteine O-methyltransferase Ste14
VSRGSTTLASSRLADLPRLGRRGEGWFALQLGLMILVGLSALTGVYWPDSLTGVLVVVGLALIVAALLLLALAGISLLLARATTVFPRPRERAELAESGVYRRVRHPVYGAVLLLAVGWSLAESPLGLIPAALLAVVFDLKARVEEAWLEEQLPGYARYRERTPRRFVPGLY